MNRRSHILDSKPDLLHTSVLGPKDHMKQHLKFGKAKTISNCRISKFVKTYAAKNIYRLIINSRIQSKLPETPLKLQFLTESFLIQYSRAHLPLSTIFNDNKKYLKQLYSNVYWLMELRVVQCQ